MPRQLFITGTDTHVGKTLVSAVLASLAVEANQSVCLYKPIQTGVGLNDLNDPQQICQWLGQEVPWHCSYQFEPPVTPWIADERDEIQLKTIENDYNRLAASYDYLLVEGAGGLRVPVTSRLEMVDLIQHLGLSVILVTRATLGTINHTLLSIEALRTREIQIEGVVITDEVSLDKTSDVAVQSLMQVFQAFLPVPVLAWVPPLRLESGSLAPGAFQIPQQEALQLFK